jgi:hypothetical protein
MKTFQIVFISLLFVILNASAQKRDQVSSSPAAIAGNGLSVYGVFDGRSPCKEISKQLQMSVDADCFKLKWRLTLYHDAATSKPATYKLEGTLFRKKVREGSWSVVRGTKTDPQALVYRLHGDNPIYLLKGDENVLFFLDDEKTLLQGDAQFSYTLNRVNK